MHHNDRRDYSSSHRNHHHHHHRRGGGGRRGRWRGGGGGPRRSGNRFQVEQHRDPQQEMITTLQTMLTGFQFHDTDRVKNAQLLASVVCGSQAEQFLGTSMNATSVLQQYSPMVVQLIHCVCVWPTQTALYAALTLLIHETSATVLLANNEQQQLPFAQRCLTYALALLRRDLDAALLVLNVDNDSTAAALGRCRCLLAYLIRTAQLGLLPLHTANDTYDAILIPAAIQHAALPSVAAVVQALVVAAQQAETRRLPAVAYRLCSLVLDVVPYLLDGGSPEGQTATIDAPWIEQQIVAPVQEILARSYQSPYEPGVGRSAILLQSPVLEAGEEEDEDDEEEEDDDEAPAPVCDSLQDALRAVQQHLGSMPTKLATFMDTPWSEMTAPQSNSTEMDVEQGDAAAAPPPPLVYASRTSPTVDIHLFPICQSITALLTNNTSNDVQFLSQQQPSSLGIMGRFPIFGPPGAEDDDEDEEEAVAPKQEDGDDATMDATPSVAPRLKSYQENYSQTDRYFCGALIRDILYTQHPSVSATGIEHGSVKQVAERIWNVRHLHPAEGMEYCALETLWTVLLVQSEEHALYVSRVLLEVTKLEPKFFTAAILTAVSNLYEDYMPSLTPRSRSTLASWLAFHLTHTDYQWPSAYWKHWEDTATNNNSRALFCQQLVSDLSEAVSNPNESLVADCFPADSKFAQQLVGTNDEAVKMEEETEFMSDLRSRLGKSRDDDADTLLQHLKASEHDDKLRALLTAMLLPQDETADVLGAFADHLGYTRTVVLGLIADDDVTTVETRMLQLVEQIANDRSLVAGILQVLVCSSTVSVQGVFSWIFDPTRPQRIPRWWETALLALRLGLETMVQGNNDVATQALNFFDPLLSGALQSVSSLISAHTEQAQGKRIPIEQIELVEGFKYVMCGAETMFLSLAKPSAETTTAALQDVWNESTVSGPRLASLLDADGLPAIDLLRGILERL